MMRVGNIIRNLTALKNLTNFVIPIGKKDIPNANLAPSSVNARDNT